jgi:hypothetical protein
MLDVAYKESAVVCQALADGRQSLILQKSDKNSSWEFGEGPTRFWLWPTYSGESKSGVKPDVSDLEKKSLAAKPPDGTVRLTHIGDVGGIFQVRDEMALMSISALHVWSDDVVRAMFHAGPSGVLVIPIRVFRSAKAYEIPEKAGNVEYDRFTFLDRGVAPTGLQPVLDDEAYRDVIAKLEAVLRPTALA